MHSQEGVGAGLGECVIKMALHIWPYSADEHSMFDGETAMRVISNVCEKALEANIKGILRRQ